MVKRTRREAVTPRNVLDQLVGVAGTDVLIGGQALAFWVEYYGVEVQQDLDAISRDVDFLTVSPISHASLHRYGDVLKGEVFVHAPNRMTALVGQAYKAVSEQELLNVDVMWTVIGLEPERVRRNAVRAQRGDALFLVMHPMDVLRSRLANVHQLPHKADEKGLMQLTLAIGVVRQHLRTLATQSAPDEIASGRSPLQPMVSELERLALDGAGRKVAKRHHVYVADAIDPTVIPAGAFWEKKWPQLRALMSPAYAGTIHPPG